MRPLLHAACAALLSAGLHANGVGPETSILIVDPRDPDSLRVANHYVASRGLPPSAVLHAPPVAASAGEFWAAHRRGLEGELARRGIEAQTSLVILSAHPRFQSSAAGLVADACFPVGRFSSIAPYILSRTYPAGVPAGASSQVANAYYTTGNAPLAFDARLRWSGGVPVASGGARYLLCAQLGQVGPLGNTVEEILSMLARSAAADATFPAGDFHFCQTTDLARSGPRHDFYPSVAGFLNSIGSPAQHIQANLPPAGAVCTGVMTGLADPAIDATPFLLAPGAFADHLTSYAGTLDNGAQVKMTRWIAKGAAGTSGTVEEPCNYPGKFPRANLHAFYAQGLTLGEAWFRSLGFAPFQVLFVGDPLCRPFGAPPQVVLSAPSVASGTIAVSAQTSSPVPGTNIVAHEFYVDGMLLAEKAAGNFALDTTSLDDGWHELRVVARDSSPAKVAGRAVQSLVVSNHGRSATLAASVASGGLRTRFDLSVATFGGVPNWIEVRHNGRVVASGDGSTPLAVHGRMLGAGPVRLVAHVQHADGRRCVSSPLELNVDDTDAGGAGAQPLAYELRRRLRADAAAWIELPYTSDGPLAQHAAVVVSNPAQASVQLFDGLNAALLIPSAGAAGTDSFDFRIDGPVGSSAIRRVHLEWTATTTCPQPEPYCVAAPGSHGLAATMGWNGSTSIAANAFELACYDLPASANGLFFLGTQAAQAPFGNGTRCVAGLVARTGVQSASVFGEVARRIDFGAAPWNAGATALRAGSTWHAQFWYRNAAAGGAGFNLSNGLRVVFCP
jgi:hypothetical protein